MKQFLISYQFTYGTPDDWHASIREFIAHIQSDPELHGKISYRCMKSANSNWYYHLACPQDEAVVKVLETREWFRQYQEKTKQVAGGTLTVTPLEVIAETTK